MHAAAAPPPPAVAGLSGGARPPRLQVFKSIPYCIQLAGGPYVETHAAVVEAFRPPADRRAPRGG